MPFMGGARETWVFVSGVFLTMGHDEWVHHEAFGILF